MSLTAPQIYMDISIKEREKETLALLSAKLGSPVFSSLSISSGWQRSF